VSRMPGVVDVERSASAPEVSGASTCAGSDPSGCVARDEICDNGMDDDCNGAADSADEACTTCGDDILEDNDSPDAPRLEPGVYEGLQVCPGDPDFYRVRVEPRERLTVRIAFRDEDGDVDLKLFDTDLETTLESSASVTDDEELDHYSTAGGVYAIRVHGFADSQNTYSMEIEVD